MRLLWLGLICTAVSWLYLLPTFTPTKDFLKNFPCIFGLLCSIILLSIPFRKTTNRDSPLKNAFFVIPFVLFSLIVAFPYNLGILLLLVGLLINLACNKWKNLAAISAGFLLTGFILFVQGACIPIYYVLAARYHEIKILNQIAYPLTRLFGLKVSISEGIIYLPTFNDLLAFPGTLERLGFYLIFHIFIGGIILLLLFDRRWKTLLGFSSICLGYTLLRYVFLIFVFAQVNQAAIFWNPLLFAISYVPLAFVLCAIFPLRTSEEPLHFNIPALSFSKNELIFAALIFAGVFCFIGVWGFQDPGIRKPGNILIDEKHSDWEWTTKKLDKEWYGSQSTYNYYSLAEYLNYFYHVDRNIDQKLSRKLLANYDVLMLKTPTESFDEQEIENIVHFVRQGGGVWLIGDHTNIFGVNHYLNFIAERFGLRFRYDTTYDLKSGTLSVYRRPKVFPHAIVQNMPPFLFATSCTLAASPLAENVIIGYGLRSRMLAYSERGFFPERLPTHDYEFGLFLQAAAVKYGKGRVAAFTDSTCFSNFYMFIPGKPELALGYVEWLNRKNRYAFLTPIFGFIAVITLAVGVYIGWKVKKNIWGIMFFSALCASALGIAAFKTLAQVTYPLPQEHADFHKVCFESEHSDIALPVLKLVDKHPNNYHTFYVWTQRLGYVPSFEQTLEDALMKGDLVVVINPTKPFTNDEIRQVEKYVERGGSFLILDGPQNKTSTSNQLLKPFQMRIKFSEIKQSVIYNNRYKKLGPAKRSGTVIGGQAILMTGDKQPVFSIAKRGKGVMAVMSDSYIFNNSQMGGTQIVPNQEQQQIYNLEFFILERLVEHK